MARFSQCCARVVARFVATWHCKIALIGDFGLAQDSTRERQSEYLARQCVYQMTKAYEKASDSDEKSISRISSNTVAMPPIVP
jgi:hypothetical protein